MLPLSARSVPALKALARSYIQRVETLPSASALADVCHSAGVGRSHLEHRAAIVAQDGAAAARLLEAFAEERASAGVYTGFAADPPKTAWLFTGQGGQYSGMGRELYETQPLFKETLDRCAAAIADMLPRPLLDVMFAEDGAINHTSYAQPALFALEMGLAQLWRSWGVTPDVVLGHSVGQYAAACVAGVFTLEQGARLLAERGRLFGALPAGGLMAAIFAEADLIEARLASFPHVSIAAYNGAHIVVSGPQQDVRALAEMFRGEGRRTEELETSHAFHSELLEPALDAFEAFAGETPFEAPTRTLICNRTGKPLPTNPLAAQTRLDAQYWRRHSREPVRFAQSAQTLAELGCRVLLEVGPQPVLAAMALRAWPEGRPTPLAVASLRRDSSDARQIEESLGQLYAAGARIDFRAVDAPWSRSKVDLPKYPFQRKRFWFQAARRDAHSFAGSGEERALASDASLALRRRHFRRRRFPDDGPAPNSWLADAPQEERLGLVVERLKAEIGHALHMSAAEIDPHAAFAALGMDSLTAMELRSRLQAALGAAIPVALFIESPDVSTLATRLIDWWGEQRGAAAKRQPPMTRRPRDRSPLPLSFNQEALWFLHELAPGSSAYNVAAAVRIRGALDAAVMQRSLDAIVARHESLRTSFRSERGVAQPHVAASLQLPLPVEPVRDEEEAAEWARREAGAPFDLAQAPLFRARLLRFDETHHILLATMHHIVTDGWSFAVLLRELSAVYRAFTTGEPWPLPELPIHYADYAAWQREWLAGETLDELLAFWKAELSGVAPLALPTDRPAPRTPSFRGRRLRFSLGAERAKALRALAQAEGVTLFAPLLAALAAVLQRHSGQDDFIVGAMSANRGRLEIEGLIGLFVNALPVRVVLDGDPDMHELIARLGARAQGAMAHQDAPFDHVVNAVERERDGSRNPLYRVQLLLQAGLLPPALPGLEIDVQEIDTQTAKRDLTFTIFDDAAMAGHVEYSTDLFDAPRIERLLRHFLIAIDGILADPSRRLSALPLLTPEELRGEPHPGAVAAALPAHSGGAVRIRRRHARRCDRLRGRRAPPHLCADAIGRATPRALAAGQGNRPRRGGRDANRAQGGYDRRHARRHESRRRLCADRRSLSAGPYRAYARRGECRARRRRPLRRRGRAPIGRAARDDGRTFRPGLYRLHLGLHGPAERRGHSAWRRRRICADARRRARRRRPPTPGCIRRRAPSPPPCGRCWRRSPPARASSSPATMSGAIPSLCSRASAPPRRRSSISCPPCCGSSSTRWRACPRPSARRCSTMSCACSSPRASLCAIRSRAIGARSSATNCAG